MNKTLLKDMEDIENICIRFGDKQDVWADRVIYRLAVTIFHILDYIRRKEMN